MEIDIRLTEYYLCMCQRTEKGFDVADKNILNNVGPENDVNGMEKGIDIVMNLAWRKLIVFIAVGI